MSGFELRADQDSWAGLRCVEIEIINQFTHRSHEQPASWKEAYFASLLGSLEHSGKNGCLVCNPDKLHSLPKQDIVLQFTATVAR